MAIKTSGSLSIQDIVNEFGGSSPHSLGEYYRGGGLVPDVPLNNNVPTSGAISLDDFYGAANATLVTYQIIGGGGGGGFGLENHGGSGRGGAGGSTTLSGDGVSGTGTVTANGGIGGLNGSLPHGASGAGASTVFGPGGASVGNGSPGRNAPATSYGAGGSGGGGDSPSHLDSSGNCGDGGGAGQYLTATVTMVYGTQLTITVGAGGTGGTGGDYAGGNGAGGICILQFDGKTVDFTSNATYVIN